MTKFQDQLKLKMHLFIKLVYKVSRDFPSDELFGVRSQLRRAGMSVILNYIEGYARFKPGCKVQYYENSYGSLKESKYLIYFCYTESYILQEDYDKLINMAEEIGAMLWSELNLAKSL
ncbi:four helix bundle protein [Patescibacteria group bacterium]|nr:four helix bundle protein [Patescibacteria group bacterium]MBU1895645.1 four helix bundle protein [Patescibacteria group bacterium]